MLADSLTACRLWRSSRKCDSCFRVLSGLYRIPAAPSVPPYILNPLNVTAQPFSRAEIADLHYLSNFVRKFREATPTSRHYMEARRNGLGEDRANRRAGDARQFHLCLGLTEDALRGRSARGRARLRSRLTRRGVQVSGILITSRPGIRAAMVMPSGLSNSTVQAAMSVSAGKVLDAGLISQTAISLSETSSTGPDADPFPGVTLIYVTDDEDGYAIRQAVLASGKSITFRTPWLINPKVGVNMIAFFLDISPQTQKRGSYTLTVTTDGKQVAPKILKDALKLHGQATTVSRSPRKS